MKPNYYTNGCHWGGPVSKTPSFFCLCLREQIAITPGLGKYYTYNAGDRILLISGMHVEGVAEITDSYKSSADDPSLESEFNRIIAAYHAPDKFLFYKARVVKANLEYGDIRYNYNVAYYPIKNEDTISKIDQLLS